MDFFHFHMDYSVMANKFNACEFLIKYTLLLSVFSVLKNYERC